MKEEEGGSGLGRVRVPKGLLLVRGKQGEYMRRSKGPCMKEFQARPLN